MMPNKLGRWNQEEGEREVWGLVGGLELAENLMLRLLGKGALNRKKI